MDLVSAIEPGAGPVCVVGAGGKTTTMYALASRLERAVVTATVRIPVFDREVAEIVVAPAPLDRLDTLGTFPVGLVPERERDDRYRGYDPETVDAVAREFDGPLLVKADGARMREFKAPDETEPRIPSSAGVVVPVVSSHVVGKPLTGAWVHRPKQVAALTDTSLGDPVTPETVATVVAHEQGGLKAVPSDARVVPLVTKVDSPEHERAAEAIAERIHERAEDLDVTLPRVALARFDAFDAV